MRLYYYKSKQKHYGEEGEIKGWKGYKISFSLTGIMKGILAEGYKACEWWDYSSAAAYINAEQKLAVVIGELREKDRGRYVADDLTGKGGE